MYFFLLIVVPGQIPSVTKIYFCIFRQQNFLSNSENERKLKEFYINMEIFVEMKIKFIFSSN